MILRILAISAGLSLSVALCRYTVRDVGFVDLGDPGYQLYAFVSDTSSPGVASACGDTAKTKLLDTNIEFEVIDLDADEHHAAYRHVRELEIKNFPCTVLVHPDGQAIELPLGEDSEQARSKFFEDVASSKLRRRITGAVLRHYCVVLLVEGDDAAKNREAAEAVSIAFKAIEKVFDQMPKKVGELPLLIHVPRAEQTSERVLLWSLGIEAKGPRPIVTVMTGRGRQFGPVLEGSSINDDTVLGILSKAGESCECGLDRSWMRGLRVPLRWDAETRQLASDQLGFDPENPLVKAEISSIVSKGANGKTVEGGGEPTVADLLLGYSEAAIAEEPPLNEPAEVVESVTDDSDSAGLGTSIWVTLIGLILANMGIAAYVVLRVRRR